MSSCSSALHFGERTKIYPDPVLTQVVKKKVPYQSPGGGFVPFELVENRLGRMQTDSPIPVQIRQHVHDNQGRNQSPPRFGDSAI
jgi:hypothetical protein